MYKDYVPGPAGGFQSRCKFMLSDVSTGGYQSAPIQCNSLVQKLLILCLVALIFLLTKILQTRLVASAKKIKKINPHEKSDQLIVDCLSIIATIQPKASG